MSALDESAVDNADNDDEQHLYFDRAGNPADFYTWAADCQTPHRLAEDTVQGLWISTAWTGLNTTGSTPPLIFETMIFDELGSEGRLTIPEPTLPYRYATEAQAVLGHQEIVDAIRAGRQPS